MEPSGCLASREFGDAEPSKQEWRCFVEHRPSQCFQFIDCRAVETGQRVWLGGPSGSRKKLRELINMGFNILIFVEKGPVEHRVLIRMRHGDLASIGRCCYHCDSKVHAADEVCLPDVVEFAARCSRNDEFIESLEGFL